ncbi:hypothetical protein NM208_g872 [Fusarium decemcellulare]|uniref:Uncharacterized protein n=1 Tax=Fusarium decemcellulare TaxID=57161 RepID=A0ACC1SY69_9HYPO|nr:hypothetical protein NM208_g872 [Fusarium decemcellulare]
MAQNPTLVFVPGAWHTPEYWGKMVTILEAQQYKCVTVALPTVSSNIETTLPDDVNAVRGAILAETTQGRNVVVVVHSYGGCVGASAMKGLTAKTEGDPENSGRVIGLFMIATGFMVSGVTFLGHSGGKPPPFWDANYESGLAILTADTRELFYHDLPEEEGKYWVGRLENHSLKAFTTGADVGYPGWKEVPCWFLATAEDKALPIEVQRMFVQGAKDEGGDVTLREIATSHSPMLSKADETVTVLLEAVKAFTS